MESAFAPPREVLGPPYFLAEMVHAPLGTRRIIGTQPLRVKMRARLNDSAVRKHQAGALTGHWMSAAALPELLLDRACITQAHLYPPRDLCS